MPARKQLVVLVKKAGVFQELARGGRLVTNSCGACEEERWVVRK